MREPQVVDFGIQHDWMMQHYYAAIWDRANGTSLLEVLNRSGSPVF